MNDKTKIDHIGIAVPDINIAKKQYELLGYVSEQEEIIREEEYGVKTLMMRLGDWKIELLEPLEKGKESPIDTYIEKRPYKMYHLAYEVSDFDKELELLQKNKFIKINEPRISKSAGGKKSIFLFDMKMGIIELIGE